MMYVKAVLRIAYSNKKTKLPCDYIAAMWLKTLQPFNYGKNVFLSV